MTDTDPQLNSIFSRLLLDLKVADGNELNLIKTAFSEVLNVVGQRCSVCDSKNLICKDCDPALKVKP